MLRVFILGMVCAAAAVAVGQQPLPPPRPERPTNDLLSPLISLAGESVVLRPPRGWEVWERPQGREVRLVLTPSATTTERLVDGVWICFHHPGVSRPAQSREERMTARFERHRANRRVIPGPRAPIRIRQARGLQQEFHLEDSRSGRLAGVHMLADTNWGTLEVFAIAPVGRYPQRKPEIQRLLHSIRLTPPQRPQPPSETVQAAAAILGSWKSFRSRIHLRVDGDILVVVDKATRLSPQGAADSDSAPPRKLSGRFTAEGDLLYVTWKDGSRLNMRWRLDGQRLLLTDHQGQTAQLDRIVQ